MTLGCSFKSALNHVFLSPSQTRWNGHFQPNASSLIYCPMKWRHPALKGWLAFQKRQAFLSPRGMKQSLKLQLELADGTGGKPSLARRRGSFLDVVIFPAVNKANKFWSGACVPEKGADCTVPTVWSLLATARQIKQGKGKGWGVEGTASFMPLNWVCSTLENRDMVRALSISPNCMCWQVKSLQMTYLTQILGKAPELVSKFCFKPQFYKPPHKLPNCILF